MTSVRIVGGEPAAFSGPTAIEIGTAKTYLDRHDPQAPPYPRISPLQPAGLAYPMSLTGLIARESILPASRASSKKQALQDLSDLAARQCGLPAREIFDVLLQRERLGSTGVGNGIAIPHGKLARVTRIFGAFTRLERPIDFESLDGEPVDLVFLLLAPEAAGADHLKALARAARLLRMPAVTAKLRASRDAATLFAILAADATPHAA